MKPRPFLQRLSFSNQRSSRLTAPARSEPSVESVYIKRRDAFVAEATRYRRHTGTFTAARGLVFLAAVACLVMGALDSDLRPMWISIGILGMILFLAIATWHDWRQRQADRAGHLGRINEWQRARHLRSWHEFPVPQVDVPAEHQALARDLDLFGRSSLFHLLSIAHTPRGRLLLRDWMLDPAGPDEIRARQKAVAALTGQVELREELFLRGHLLEASLAGPEAMIEWAESDGYLAVRPGVKWTSRALTLLTLVILLAVLTGWLVGNGGVVALIGTLLVNALFSVLFTGAAHDIFNNINTRNGEMRHYLAMFDVLAQAPVETPRLRHIQQQAVRHQQGALTQLRRLRSIIMLANLRHASLLSIVYFGLQAVVLWDFHVLAILELWQARCRPLVRLWFDALAELEALSSLAGLAHDQPGWVFPLVATDAPPKFRADQLGHPLIADDQRVRNDVEIGPAGTVLLVTGSNMSGKSTLLRSIGVNAILAESGGPVCADQLEMPPMRITTSMRIHDSLEDGVSFFMAELKRLKQIVDLASEFTKQEDRLLLYLLDEILQGTNSVERHLAVARVLAHLVTEGAIGAVSTHDLDLAKSEELVACCRTVHFRETFHSAEGRQSMTFDYLLRDGVATTTNALKLLQMVGLD